MGYRSEFRWGRRGGFRGDVQGDVRWGMRGDFMRHFVRHLAGGIPWESAAVGRSARHRRSPPNLLKSRTLQGYQETIISIDLKTEMK
jgi:hypothetical protein